VHGVSKRNEALVIGDNKNSTEDDSERLCRIQGAERKRWFDRFKKRLHLTTAPPWYNCKKCTFKQGGIEVGWLSTPYHLLPYIMHLWSCRSYTVSSLI
jgi:hypothetical protein